MSFIEDLKEGFERLKRKLGISWQNLLEQIPEINRLDNYYWDPILRKYVPKTVMPSETPVLDEYQRLKVETPNFKEYFYENKGETISTWIHVDLDFLADSLSIAIFDMSGTYPSVDFHPWYVFGDAYPSGKVSIDTFSYGADPSNIVYQYDLKPCNRFMIDISPDSSFDGVFKVKVLFSKQKKTKISDLVYSSNWNAISDIAPSKNSLYDKIVLMIAEYVALISDIAYDESTWNAITTIAPSKNAIRDKIEAMITAYNNLNHNDLKNINAGTDYEHITQTQKDALHAIVVISDIAYDESTWNTNTDGATKNVIRDWIEALAEIDITDLDKYTQDEVDDLIPIASEFDHNDLGNINAGTDNEHLTQTQVDALHAVLTNLTQLATRNHNDLLNINAGTDNEHITQTQKDALHAVLTNLTQLATRNHNDLLNINAGTDYEHITQTQKDAILNSKKVILDALLMPRTEQMFNGARIDLIAQGTDYVGVNFLVHADIVDDSQEILFIWVYRVLGTDASFAMQKFRASIKSDNSETHSWNLDNATGFNMNVTANRIKTETFTFGVNDYDSGDHLYSLIRLNDASADMYIEGCYIVFYLK